jgi:hypothetical protein
MKQCEPISNHGSDDDSLWYFRLGCDTDVIHGTLLHVIIQYATNEFTMATRWQMYYLLIVNSQ